MTKLKMLAIVMIAIVALLVAPCAACLQPNLENKDPGTWVVISDDTSGYVNTNNLKVQANGLVAFETYSLIYYPDFTEGWTKSRESIIVLGESQANKKGELKLNGDITKLLFDPDDINVNDFNGYKLWIVPSDTIDCGGKLAWEPERFLFEVELFPVPVYAEVNANLENKDSTTWDINYGDGRYGIVDPATMQVRAYGLEKKTQYKLIYYPDLIEGWTKSKESIIVLGKGKTNNNGKLTLNGDVNDLVLDPDDININDFDGYKLWLVPSDTIVGGQLTWAPDRFLFEVALFPIASEPTVKTSSSGSATWVPRLISVEGGEIVELQGVNENGIYRFMITSGTTLNSAQTIYYQETGDPYYNKNGERVYSMRTTGEIIYSIAGTTALQVRLPNREIRLEVRYRNDAYNGIPTLIELKDVSNGEILWSTILEEKIGDWTFQI